MHEYKSTRQAVMGLLAELAKHADFETARRYKQAKSIHSLATRIAVSTNDCSAKNPPGFKRGADRDVWLATRDAT
jgi:hypothetical protein